jgi:hypothetical protein
MLMLLDRAEIAQDWRKLDASQLIQLLFQGVFNSITYRGSEGYSTSPITAYRLIESQEQFGKVVLLPNPKAK